MKARDLTRIPLAGLLMSSAASAMVLAGGAALVGALTAVVLTGCEDAPAANGSGGAGPGGSSAAAAGSGGSGQIGGEELLVDVSTGRVQVKLAPPSVVASGDDWDLAFEGLDVFTNSGPSGPGAGSGFGPLDPGVFEAGTDPGVPFTTPDRAGGAFLDWYLYEGAPAHVLWSRYHVHAVGKGERRWKVQLLGYYGNLDGEPVAGLYRLRYAELTADGVGPTREIASIDATAGGVGGPATAPSACLDLASGTVTALAPTEAATRTDWDLCMRRDVVTVNGEQGGPGTTTAADLDAALTAGEQLAAIEARTADSELAHFDAVTRASLDGVTLRGDHIVSVFGTSWLDRSGAVPGPATGSWLVVGPDSKRRALITFARFDDASATTPGTVHLHIKSIPGNPLT